MSDPNPLRQELEALRQKQDGGVTQVAQPSAQRESGGVMDTLSRNVAQPFNEGVVDLVNMPISLTNLILGAFGGPQIPGTSELQASLSDMGMIAPEGEREGGFIPESMRILGGSAIPGMGVSTLGTQVLKRGIPLAERTAMQHMAAETASKPTAAAGADILSSFMAGGGGEVAQTLEPDNPMSKPLGQIAGAVGIPGTLAAANLAVNKLPLVRTAKDAVMDVPYSFNPQRRAANELQSRSVSPDDSAARIDSTSPMPPALQAGDDRLVALHNRVLEEVSPKKAKQVAAHIKQTESKAIKEATDFGGDKNAVREVLETKSRSLVKQHQERAKAAVDEANAALETSDPGMSPADISRSAREKIDAALAARRAAEREAWSEVDNTVPAGLDNTRKAVNEILEASGRYNKAEAVPPKIKQALDDEEAYLSLLAKDTLTEAEQTQLDAMEGMIFKDIHGLRQEVQDLKAAAIGDRRGAGTIRRLNQLEESLLADMEAAQPEGLEAARQVSKELNDLFTRGPMGRVLQKEDIGVLKNDPADTLNAVFSGKTQGRNVEHLLKGTPEARNDVADYIRKTFIIQASNADGVIQKSAADRVIKNLKSQRIFEDNLFPDLENELRELAVKSSRADIASKRAAIIKDRGGARLDRDSKESLASLMLGQEKGSEVSVLFKPSVSNKAQIARKLRSRMEGNANAVDGLKSQYAKELMKQAHKGTDETGEGVINGAKYTRLLKENMEVLKALGFEKDQIARMRRTAAILRQAQKKGAKMPEQIINDVQSSLIDLPVSFIGAQAGGHLARHTAGGSLQMAGRGASFMRKLSKFLTRNKAERLLIDAHDDPELYKALLIKPLGAKPIKLQAAEKKLKAWMLGVSSEAVETVSEDQKSNGLSSSEDSEASP